MDWKTASRYFFAATMIGIGVIGLIRGGFAPIWDQVPKETPARELLAETLLVAHKPVDSLAEYDAVMKKEPNRYRAISCAMTAARAAGDERRARALAAELLELGAESDTPRESLRQAKEMAGG